MDTNEWAAAALQFWLQRWVRQAASDLRAEGLPLVRAAARCRQWRP